jgi:hypothetical protein
MNRSTVTLVFATALMGAGCLSRAIVLSPPGLRFRPDPYEGSRAGPLAARIEMVRVPGGDSPLTVTMALFADEVVLIRGATVASSAAAPCAAGRVAEIMVLDQQPRWDRPVGVKGNHELALEFPGAIPFLAEPGAVLDLQISGTGGDSCLRLPFGPSDLTTSVPTLRPERRLTGGGVARAGFPLRRAPYAIIDDELRIELWLKDLQIGAEMGWIWQGCPGGCDQTPGLEFPAWLFAEVVPLRARGYGLGVEAAYGFIYGPATGGDWWLHGPRLALHLVELSPSIWPGGAEARGRGLELSLAYQRAASGPLPPTFILGVGLVAF